MIETGARPYKLILGNEVYAGGFPFVFDCVSSAESLNQCLRYASPGGRIVVLGCAAKIPDLDLSFLWSRELEMKGFLGYGLAD